MAKVKEKKTVKRESLLLAGVEWTVLYMSPLKDESDNNLQGDTSPDTRIIRINSTYSEDRQAQTLLHECMHAVLYMTGQAEHLSPAQEEGIVLGLEHTLWPILPRLLKKVKPESRTSAAK
jgi:Zn-dependent peptidase ImmA (M78 family)